MLPERAGSARSSLRKCFVAQGDPDKFSVLEEYIDRGAYSVKSVFGI
jgi:hypothetical protein